MSLVRMGLSENKKYGDGFDAIFGKKKSPSKVAATKPIKKAAKKKTRK